MPVDITSTKGFCLEIFRESYILFMFLFSLFRHYFLKNIFTCLNIKNVFDNLCSMEFFPVCSFLLVESLSDCRIPYTR